ncbi:Do family serine endopeptidase [Aquisalinus flavus]|uniref:Serine protease n=1 Tax=Aquisalinus flavus TaxID=1526572 RepID=A0A8J2V1V4_9PROT|nr:Do family serine endopeptidase [Aquisalinus flavus]MBD0427973.1 Do family serine endopeptidase [Aquisalinus flavus]UNE47726.1 Do family serine endopeptidase [Aquisalinus flavus]GGD05380.1 serine protease [Aquisalinus flavus]
MRLPIIVTIAAAVLFAVQPAAAQEAERFVPQDSVQLKASFSPVVKEVAPAVVNIYTRGVVRQQVRSPFDEFFGGFGGFGGMTRERVAQSLGSGVIVRPEGIVVTNNHVVENMSEIKVVLADRREYSAQVLLTDPQTDIAILRIESDEPLPFLEFANSDVAEVGDIVLAIGNPFGVGQTVTTGIVSALARTQVGITDYQFFIQTDAAINPGNSGGALVDIDGRLLGVNSAIYSRSGGSNGIGFAIPGNLVRQVVATAVDGGGTIMRPWIGATARDIDGTMAMALGLDRPSGALVSQLFAGGPAAQAGIREGDVIIAIDGQDIVDSDAMRYRVATKEADARVPVVYLRDGNQRTVNVRLSLPPETPARDETLIGGENPFSGLKVANLSPAVNMELSRDLTDTGVVVLDASQGSYAGRFGIGKGYKILSVNGTEVETVAQLKRALADSGRGWIIQTQSPRGQVSTLRINR